MTDLSVEPAAGQSVELVRVANESCPARKRWTQAYLDVRYSSDVGNVMMLRVAPTKGRVSDQEDTAPLIKTAADHLGGLRRKRWAGKWHGVWITVTPAGEWQAEYSRDPDCAETLAIFGE